ncbi:MAG: hypothetical protein HQM11_09930 [SAR324 cluster bacterium]|nr:hypothetical protein [SAR324 cluster bacterium]
MRYVNPLPYLLTELCVWMLLGCMAGISFTHNAYGQTEPEESRSMFYMSEWKLGAGFHAMSQSGSWIKGEEETLGNDIFRRNSCGSSSSCMESWNVDSSLQPTPKVMSLVSLEYVAGIAPEQMPLLNNISSLNGLRGLRAGIQIQYYPAYHSKDTLFQGMVHYRNQAEAEDSGISYQGKITLEETFLMVVPAFNLYYFHEAGWFSGDVIPYAGLGMRLGIASGKRKWSFKTDTYVAEDGKTYNSQASIQEVFIDAMSTGTQFLGGAEMPLSGSQWLTFETGFIQHETPVVFQRKGLWRETIDGISFGRSLQKNRTNSTFSSTGAFFMLTYAIRGL